MLSALAEDPNFYEDKLALGVALAPISKQSHTDQKIVNFFTKKYDLVIKTFDLFGIYEVLGSDWKKISIPLCNVLPEFCKEMSDLFLSHHELDDKQIDNLVFHYYPNGVSVKSLKHFAQTINEDRF